MYKLTLALGLASSALVASQSTTTLLLLGFDSSQEIDASILGSDSTATSYALGCPATVDSSDCGVPPGFTFTQGPSTAHYIYTLIGDYGYGDGDVSASSGIPATADLACQITSDHGTCTGSIWGGSNTAETDETTTFAYSQFGTKSGAQAVTIVGSLAASPGAQGSSTTIASTSATTTSGAAGATPSSGSSTTASSTGSSTSSSKVSTGGMPMITGHAQWVIGGAAAAVAIAAM